MNNVELTQEQGDFVVTLSSDLISQVMEAYFNSDMFKMAVKVVDLQAKGDAYAFNLAFVKETSAPIDKVNVTPWPNYSGYYAGPNGEPLTLTEEEADLINKLSNVTYPPKRNSKGRFVKVKGE